jgi:molecular chaperone DnaK (HSP70)
VAYADRGNYPVVAFETPDGDSVDWFPSVVAEHEGTLAFGFDAIAVAQRKQASPVRSFKRLLANVRGTPSITIGTVTRTVPDLLAEYLEALTQALRTRSNLSAALRQDKSAFEVCIAVPANAHGAQRLWTLDAFRRAGYHVRSMLHEPSAAGFEYTHRHRDTLSTRRDHVVVYDLGGGTFDASLLRMTGAAHDVVATAGINALGGDDFDMVLAKLVLETAGVNPGDWPPEHWPVLLDVCRSEKERINPNTRKVHIDLDGAFGDRAPVAQVSLPVSTFFDACMPLVNQSIDAMLPVMQRLSTEAADSPAGDTPADIAGIYVVGGASELPVVPRALRQRFGRRVHRSPYASSSIAIGLAIASDDSSGFALSDRFGRTFGVFREAFRGDEVTFDPIFTRDASLPGPGSDTMVMRRSYRAAHNIGHFRFFECGDLGGDGRPHGDLTMCGEVLFPFDANLPQEGSQLSKVPVRRADAGPQVLEEYALDAHGVVVVTIRNVDAGYARTFRVGP